MTPWLDDGDVRLYHGDNLDVLRALPDRSVHMCATSPPFYGLRDYGTGLWDGGDPDCDHTPNKPEKPLRLNGQGEAYTSNNTNWDGARKSFGQTCGKCGARRVDQQIGLEDTPDQWVERLVAVFREVRRVLRDDGTLWVEIGDSYGSAGGRDWSPNIDRGRADSRSDVGRSAVPFTTTKPKDLLGQPWLLAKALRDPYYAGKIKNENDRVWLAAMIDAEGCISIHRRPAGTPNYAPYTRKDGTTANYERKNDSFQPKIEISNTSRTIMERVVAIAGGNCDTKQEAGTQGRKQTLYRWTLTADKCRDLLREVYPHLVGKQHEARLAIGCPSSGEKATAAHEALKLLHGGSTTGIDFPAPGSMWEAGWYLRSEIIWSRLRPNPMPESVTDRPTKSHSTVFLLSKQPRYFYDADAIREDAEWNFWGSQSKKKTDDSMAKAAKWDMAADGRDALVESGRNARSVWTIPTQPTPFAHFATWPESLVRRMILAGTSERGCCPECGAAWVRDVETTYTPHGDAATQHAEARVQHSDPGGNRIGRLDGATGGNRGPQGMTHGRATKTTQTLGWSPSCDCYDRTVDEDGPLYGTARTVPCTVLDPFAGSATTCLVARNHGRHSIGIELNADYLTIAARRLQQLSLLNAT